MKYIIIFTLFMVVFKTQALVVVVCADDMLIYGEVESFEVINGRVELVKQEVRLPTIISENIGQYKNIAIKSLHKLNFVKVLATKYPLKEIHGKYYTSGLNLFSVLENRKHNEKVKLLFTGDNHFSCTKEIVVVRND